MNFYDLQMRRIRPRLGPEARRCMFEVSWEVQQQQQQKGQDVLLPFMLTARGFRKMVKEQRYKWTYDDEGFKCLLRGSGRPLALLGHRFVDLVKWLGVRVEEFCPVFLGEHVYEVHSKVFRTGVLSELTHIDYTSVELFDCPAYDFTVALMQEVVERNTETLQLLILSVEFSFLATEDMRTQVLQVHFDERDAEEDFWEDEEEEDGLTFSEGDFVSFDPHSPELIFAVAFQTLRLNYFGVRHGEYVSEQRFFVPRLEILEPPPDFSFHKYMFYVTDMSKTCIHTKDCVFELGADMHGQICADAIVEAIRRGSQVAQHFFLNFRHPTAATAALQVFKKLGLHREDNRLVHRSVKGITVTLALTGGGWCAQFEHASQYVP